MKFLSTLLLSACCIFGSLQAQQYFLLYEPGCMTRIQYEQAIARQPKMDYFAYQLTLSDGNKLIFETGVEGNVRQNYLPSDYLRCNDPRLNADLVDAINGNRAKVFVLIPDGTDYLIQPVSMGAIMAKQNNLLTYVSPLASFQFDTRNVIIGENLAYNNNSAKVFFEGRETTDCQGKYLIRQLMARNAYPVIDYKIHPTLGVLERRLGSDGETTIGGVTVVRFVNGQPIDNYLAGLCGGTPVVANTAPMTYGTEATLPVVPYTPNTTAPTVNQPNPGPAPVTTAPTQPVAEVETHTVAKGETLWGLSKRFDVAVPQLREWNNLNGNTITVGQVLRVGAPALMNGNGLPEVMAQRGPDAGNTPNGPQNEPYYTGPTANNQPSANATPVDREHVVQAGETVASIALKYGYTSAKFREINGLGANEFIRIGQRLKTNSCDCPSAAAVSPRSTGNATPTTFNSGVVAPQRFTPTTNTPVATGTPVGPTSSTFRAPSNFNQPQPFNQPTTFSREVSTPQAFGGQPSNQSQNFGTPVTSPQQFSRQPSFPATSAQQQQAPANNLSITNNPGFGQKGAIVPNGVGTGAARSMNSLESGRAVIGSNNRRPATFGSPVTNGSAPASTRAFHMVQENENLYLIAQRYGLTVYQLRTLNGLSDTDVIIPFQRLYIN